MTVYTVIGWSINDETHSVSWFDARAAMDAVDAAYKQHARHGGWRPVAVFSGKLRPETFMDEVRARGASYTPSPARRTRMFTVVGFWAFSGETIVRHVNAGDGVEAFLLAIAVLGSESEMQLICALPGTLTAVVTHENLSAAYGDQFF